MLVLLTIYFTPITLYYLWEFLDGSEPFKKFLVCLLVTIICSLGLFVLFHSVLYEETKSETIELVKVP